MRDRMAEKNLNLPEDLVMEILPKLPVKSLVRFKSVSKPWKTLFKTPSFVSKQLLASSINHKNNPLLIVSEYDDGSYPASLGLKLYSDGNLLSNIYKPFAGLVSRIYGPCNGIFCLKIVDFSWLLILWNPATREVKVLPPPLCPPSDEHYPPVYGFGIDPKTNDYKIVKLLTFGPDSKNFRQPAIAEVYNLTTDSWKIINIVPTSYIYDDELYSYANGVYCWVAEDCFDSCVAEDCFVKTILCFDMSSDTFQGIMVPLTEISSNDDDVYIGDGIFVINNCISYFCQYENNYRALYEVAVMNDFSGAETTWTKLSFTLHYGRPGRSENFLIVLYGCWKDDEIILSIKPRELVYNEHGDIIHTFQPHPGFLASYKIDGIDGSELRVVQEIQVNLEKLYWLREYKESIVPLTI